MSPFRKFNTYFITVCESTLDTKDAGTSPFIDLKGVMLVFSTKYTNMVIFIFQPYSPAKGESEISNCSARDSSLSVHNQGSHQNSLIASPFTPGLGID